jgi:hypothetical protein
LAQASLIVTTATPDATRGAQGARKWPALAFKMLPDFTIEDNEDRGLAGPCPVACPRLEQSTDKVIGGASAGHDA